MIYILISIAYIIGGFKYMFESRKKYNIYLSVGFIILGIYYLLKNFFISNLVVDIVFNVPLVLAAIMLMASPISFLKEGKK